MTGIGASAPAICRIMRVLTRQIDELRRDQAAAQARHMRSGSRDQSHHIAGT